MREVATHNGADLQLLRVYVLDLGSARPTQNPVKSSSLANMRATAGRPETPRDERLDEGGEERPGGRNGVHWLRTRASRGIGRTAKRRQRGSVDRNGSRDSGYRWFRRQEKRMIARVIPDGPSPVNKRGLPPPPPTLTGPDAKLNPSQHPTRSTGRIKRVAVSGD